jgi:outer membrane receptor protein involved in Fe transport
MSTPCRKTPLGAAIVLALLASAAAHAQDADKPDAGDSSTLGTIIVTAEKRSEDIQEVPMSIGVIDETQLDNLHGTQISDYAPYIPGLTVISNGSPGQESLGIRGVAPRSAGSTVAPNNDETPHGTSSNYGGGSTHVLDLLPFDFQSVEVLRGPQGTLYGAIALGGVIRYVTKRPDLDVLSWRAGADVFSTQNGDGAGVGGRVGVNLPIVPGAVALRASFARQNSPGYTDNVRTGEKGQDEFSQQAAHADLLWQINDAASFRVQAFQSRIDTDSSSATAFDPVTLEPLFGDLKDDNYVPEPFRKEVDYYNATLNWDLGFADFVSATSYSDATQHSVLDASLVYGVLFSLIGLPENGVSAVTYDLKLYKTTQEFRLTSKQDGPLEWLVGAFWTNENSKQNQTASAQFFDLSPIPGLDPLAVVGLPSTYKEYAAFGDLTWKFSPTFDVTGGVRFAHNKQTFSQITSGALTGESNVPGGSAEGVTTWSFTPRLHLTPEQMLYVRIATGYQPGGPNLTLPGVPPSVDASTLTNYEFGWKATLDDNRLIFDASVYDIEWDDIQVSASTNGLAYLANGGTARSRGLEFSTLYAPVPGVRLGLNGAYTDAVLTEDIPSLGGLDGDRLPSIPKWAWSATADWTFPAFGNWTGRIGGGLRYVGSNFSGVEHNPNAYPQDSYTAFDLNADLSNDHWTLRLFVKNLFDERVYTNLTPLPNAATGAISQVKGVPLQPRIIGVGFDVKF